MQTRSFATPLFLLVVFASPSAWAESDLHQQAIEEADCTREATGPAARIIDVVNLRGVVDFDFAELRVEYAAFPSITIEGDGSQVAEVGTDVGDGILRLSRGACFAPEGPIRVTVAGPSFEEIRAKGEAVVSSVGGFRSFTGSTIDLHEGSQADLKIDADGEVVVFADGAGTHALEVTAPSLIALHSGSGEFALAGQTALASVAELGRGTIATKYLDVGRLVAEIAGGGAITALR